MKTTASAWWHDDLTQKWACHIAVWDRELTDDEMRLLATELPTQVAPESLIRYLPLLRPVGVVAAEAMPATERVLERLREAAKGDKQWGRAGRSSEYWDALDFAIRVVEKESQT